MNSDISRGFFDDWDEDFGNTTRYDDSFLEHDNDAFWTDTAPSSEYIQVADIQQDSVMASSATRSEERRVGKECCR